jgi:geranylgeranyl diphosphate synthase type II
VSFPHHLTALVEDEIRRIADEDHLAALPDVRPLAAAVRYPLEAGGKRLRPVLLLATVDALGGRVAESLPAAVALEWVHTFSLVHDDLPALDDDDLRRGRPTTHIAYGEDVAVLVGDALLNGAYRLVLDRQRCPASRRAVVLRAMVAGIDGMIAGQYLDVRPPAHPDGEWLRRMCSLKTGALLRAAVAMGIGLAGAAPAWEAAYLAVADELGVGFQIVDDVLDATGTDDALGKPAGSDAEHGKRTYVTVLGLDRARELARASEGRCRELLDALPGRPDAFRAIVERVYARDR